MGGRIAKQLGSLADIGLAVAHIAGAELAVSRFNHRRHAVLGKTITLTRSATTGWSCATTVEAQYAAKGCGANGA